MITNVKLEYEDGFKKSVYGMKPFAARRDMKRPINAVITSTVPKEQFSQQELSYLYNKVIPSIHPIRGVYSVVVKR